MRWLDARVILGVLLLLAGVLLLLANLGYLVVGLQILWGLLFAAGGLAFLAVYLDDRSRWWALIPAFVLLSLGLLIGVESVAPAVARVFGGTIFLGGIGLGFVAVYLTRRDFWWAIIPAGVLITLAVVAAIGQTGAGQVTGAIFFLGLGLTFALLYLLPTPGGRQMWALIPAAVLLAMGLLVAVAATDVLGYLFPALLILAGVYLLYRATRPRPTV